MTTSVASCARRRRRRSRGRRYSRGCCSRRPARAELVAQLLDLLEDLLELVLRAAQRAREPVDVLAAGDAQVAQHEVHRLVADARDRDDVLGHHRQQLAEAVAGHDTLGGLGDAAFGLLIQTPDLLVGRRRGGPVVLGGVGHRCRSLCPRGH
jgi:hypothetical protein